jgi:hypothetical protein
MSDSPNKSKLDEADLIHLIRGAGHHMPEGFIDEVLQKAKEIDRLKELEKEKAKGRDMLDD